MAQAERCAVARVLLSFSICARLHEGSGTLGSNAGADLLANLGEIHEKQGALVANFQVNH